MFIGHYAVALASKRWRPEVPLWGYFLAVQWLDVLLFCFVLARLEVLRVTPGVTGSRAYEWVFTPYSHSLEAAALWALVFGGAGALAIGSRMRGAVAWRVAGWLTLCVVSHFFLDVLMHVADLPLTLAGSPKVGLGLGSLPLLSAAVELVAFAAGWWVLPWRHGRYRVLGLLGGLTVGVDFALPAPPSPQAAAVQGLVACAVFAGFAWWAERSPRRPDPLPIVSGDAKVA